MDQKLNAIEKIKEMPEHLQWPIFQAFCQKEMEEHFSKEQIDDIFKVLRIAINIFSK